MSREFSPIIISSEGDREQIIPAVAHDLKKRRIFVREIDSESEALIISLLLYLNEKSDEDIYMIINSPGGVVTDGMAIYDTMQSLHCDVVTIANGLAASMGAFLLSCGTPGKRYASPNADIMLHQPIGGINGQADDVSILADHIMYKKEKIAEIIAKNCGKSKAKVLRDTSRDYWMTAQQALDYGLIDHIEGLGKILEV